MWYYILYNFILILTTSLMRSMIYAVVSTSWPMILTNNIVIYKLLVVGNTLSVVKYTIFKINSTFAQHPIFCIIVRCTSEFAIFISNKAFHALITAANITINFVTECRIHRKSLWYLLSSQKKFYSVDACAKYF